MRGVRGLGRFFKQVCQSARQGSQDDFLGCINIPIAVIESEQKCPINQCLINSEYLGYSVDWLRGLVQIGG